MSVARLLPFLAVALVASAPAAQAYAQPVFYFLKDAPGVQDQVPDVPSPIPLPVAVPTLDVNPGILDPYDPQNPNAPAGNTSKERLVPVGTELVLPVQFVTPEGHTHPDRLRGPLFVGLWLGESVVAHGNMTATLYEIPADGAAIALANATVALDLNQSKAPDPMSLVPQNTSDPQAIVFYEVAQVLPLILQPPALFVLGPVDLAFGNSSTFAIGFAITQGSSPGPAPVGAFGSIKYDGAWTPSFVYAPWYAPDPPKPTTTKGPTTSFGSSQTFSGRAPTPSTVPDDDKDTPGLAVPMGLAALLAAAAIAARRRTK